MIFNRSQRIAYLETSKLKKNFRNDKFYVDSLSLLNNHFHKPVGQGF